MTITTGTHTTGADGLPDPAADYGLYGPYSVTWRVMPTPIMWVAGFRALYLQMLHPRVMRGTWQNTAFADPKQAWGRFVRTTEFVVTRTYGSLAEVERAGHRVRSLHSHLRGTDPDGTEFRLNQPELLMWVHCTEVASYAGMARRVGLAVTPAELDAFVAEQRRSAALVGLDPQTVPASVAAVEDYLTSMRPQLAVTPEARQALLQGFLNPTVPMPVKVVLPGLAALGFASLPRWARRLFRMPGSPLTDLATTVSLRALHESTNRIPGSPLLDPSVRSARDQARAVHQEHLASLAAAS
ncbi:MAG TPA: oxygenase MpaB family protein [Streptosporangiaceae bacterium]|nr:oxygenase MpaB family protein [Streptosporangiaceae bacterium]